LVYQIKILGSAIQDVRNCYEFLAEYSPENAKKWIDGLRTAFTSLTTMPKRCPIAPETDFMGFEVRCLVYLKYYRILYSIDNDLVLIYHIRHTSQELMSPEDFLA
jgi:plasmid stabilization system protein ParE